MGDTGSTKSITDMEELIHISHDEMTQYIHSQRVILPKDAVALMFINGDLG